MTAPAARLMPTDPVGADLDQHVATYGALDVPSEQDARAELRAAVVASSLRGRGGAWFPTGRKMTTVQRNAGKHRRRSVVVCNAMEGEPSSTGDAWLLEHNPHLVLDGVQLAAALVDAKRGYVAVHEDAPGLAFVRRALAQRRHDQVPVKVVPVPPRYVASEESALCRFIGGGPAIPLFGERPFEHGVRGRPTLVDNTETLAHVALIARHGADWFREVGTESAPGTTLVSVGGAVATPGPLEIPVGTPVHDILARAGGAAEELSAFRTGGFGGTWSSAADVLDLPWAPDEMRAHGVAIGSGILWALPTGRCGLRETARVLEYLAGESAGQCGTCTFGLSAVADDFSALAERTAMEATLDRLTRRLSTIPRRGGCSLPDGAVRLAQSALSVFADDVHAHCTGACLPAPDGDDDTPWVSVPPVHPHPVIAKGKSFR